MSIYPNHKTEELGSILMVRDDVIEIKLVKVKEKEANPKAITSNQLKREAERLVNLRQPLLLEQDKAREKLSQVKDYIKAILKM